MSLARPLADAGKYRDALVALHHGVDQLHHQHGLANAGAAKHRRLAPARQRTQQIEHLDPRLEHRARRGLVGQRRRGAVDRPARRVVRQVRATVSHRPHHVQQPSQDRLADRHAERCACRLCDRATREPRGILQRDRPHRSRIEVRLHLGDQGCGAIPGNRQRFLDRRQCQRVEAHVQHRPAHRDHAAARGIRVVQTGHPASARSRAPDRPAQRYQRPCRPAARGRA